MVDTAGKLSGVAGIGFVSNLPVAIQKLGSLCLLFDARYQSRWTYEHDRSTNVEQCGDRMSVNHTKVRGGFSHNAESQSRLS